MTIYTFMMETATLLPLLELTRVEILQEIFPQAPEACFLNFDQTVPPHQKGGMRPIQAMETMQKTKIFL